MPGHRVLFLCDMKIPNLLLVAGSGNKSGKTTFACRVIEQFRNKGITAIKITPHFHETTPGLVLKAEGTGFAIYEETDQRTEKDSSRMLRAGAKKVYYAKVTDASLSKAFSEILSFFPEGTPIVCESPALRHFIVPGLFIIMKSQTSLNTKNINNLLRLPHVLIDLEELEGMSSLPIDIREGRWTWKET